MPSPVLMEDYQTHFNKMESMGYGLYVALTPRHDYHRHHEARDRGGCRLPSSGA